jgi:hypothetical protein
MDVSKVDDSVIQDLLEILFWRRSVLEKVIQDE